MRHPTPREASARRLVVSRLRAYCEQPDAPRGVDAGGITVAGGPGANATAEPGEASDSPRIIPTRSRLDWLHHKCISAAVDLGVAIAMPIDNDEVRQAGIKRATDKLTEAQFAHWSAMDAVHPVGGRPTRRAV